MNNITLSLLSSTIYVATGMSMCGFCIYALAQEKKWVKSRWQLTTILGWIEGLSIALVAWTFIDILALIRVLPQYTTRLQEMAVLNVSVLITIALLSHFIRKAQK